MKNRPTAQLKSDVGGDRKGGSPVRADADTLYGKTLRLAVIGANQIERDDLIGVLAATYPELIAIAFATVSECVGSSADSDVIMLLVGQDTSAQMTLEHIEQLRSTFPGVPVMAITRD